MENSLSKAMEERSEAYSLGGQSLDLNPWPVGGQAGVSAILPWEKATGEHSKATSITWGCGQGSP